jgi:hypothetical protein
MAVTVGEADHCTATVTGAPGAAWAGEPTTRGTELTLRVKFAALALTDCPESVRADRVRVYSPATASALVGV